MVQVIRALDAVLLFPGETKFAPAADTTCESDADKLPKLDLLAYTRPESYDSAHAFVAAYVRQFDVENGTPICARGSTGLRMKIY